MDPLRGDGVPIGYYANRYMRVVDADGRVTEKSYSPSWLEEPRGAGARRRDLHRPMSGSSARR